jgi:sodium transport system ATP-binding protein
MITVQNVSKKFDDFTAVDDVSFTVNPGEVVGLLGPNGAGKTTTLRMLATLLKPSAGSVTVDGIDTVVDPLEVRRRIGYQTGDTGLYDRLTPVEFLKYFGRFHRMSADHLRDRVEKVVDDLDITEFKDKQCGKLSTGQRQRVTLARTLLHDPGTLILDEPTNGLDIVSSSFIVSTLRRAADAGKAILLSTHIMGEVELTCDRIVIIDHGHIRASGSREDLMALTGTHTLTHAFLAVIEEHRSGESEVNA